MSTITMTQSVQLTWSVKSPNSLSLVYSGFFALFWWFCRLTLIRDSINLSISFPFSLLIVFWSSDFLGCLACLTRKWKCFSSCLSTRCLSFFSNSGLLMTNFRSIADCLDEMLVFFESKQRCRTMFTRNDSISGV